MSPGTIAHVLLASIPYDQRSEWHLGRHLAPWMGDMTMDGMTSRRQRSRCACPSGIKDAFWVDASWKSRTVPHLHCGWSG